MWPQCQIRATDHPVPDATRSPLWRLCRLLRGPRQPLDAARQLVLPLQLDDGVIARHAHVRVACDLAGFDGAAADFLPPRDVPWAWRFVVRPAPLRSWASFLLTIGEALGGFWGDSGG